MHVQGGPGRALRPTPVLPLFAAVYAVRYASWAIGTEMEKGVLALGERIRAEFFPEAAPRA